jgi:hypothetical protein
MSHCVFYRKQATQSHRFRVSLHFIHHYVINEHSEFPTTAQAHAGAERGTPD